MKKIILCSALIVISGCASTPVKSIPFTEANIKFAKDYFQERDGQLSETIQGAYKQVSAMVDTTENFGCSGSNTKKSVTTRVIKPSDVKGEVTINGSVISCGSDEIDHTWVENGFQTKEGLYIYNLSSEHKSGWYEFYKYEEETGKLKNKGFYTFNNQGKPKFNKSIWVHNYKQKLGLFDSLTHKTSYFVPEKNWAKLDEFELSLDGNVTRVADKPSSFNWGKALALGAGAVAGGGLSLDSDTQASVIAGIVLDSQANTSGTSNLNTAVQTSLENNAQRAAANSVIEQDIAQNPKLVDEAPKTKPSIASTSGTSNPNPTSNTPISASKCGVSSYTLAEEQAEKNRLGAIRQSILDSVPAYDYKTRNQAYRDWERGMSEWRKARHEACGIKVGGSTRVTIE